MVFLHGGGQTRRSWGRAAAAVAARGWQAVTVDLRGHGESDWSSQGDYRVVSFAADVAEVLRNLPPDPVLVGASLGGFTSMLLAGEMSPGIASAVVLVDIVPNMEQSGANRIHRFMADRVESGFGSSKRWPTRSPSTTRIGPADRSGRPDRQPAPPRRSLVLALGSAVHQRHRAVSPFEVTDPDRMHAAVEAILGSGVPMLLVRGQVSDLVSQERADEFLARFPQVEFTDVRGAGHMVAGDRNDIFAEAVLGFLTRHVGAG